MPAAVKTVSKTAVNLVSRSRSRNRSESARWPRSISRFRACWATQAPVGWLHCDNVDPAGLEFQEEQHVDPFEEHRVDGEEVARQYAVGRGAQELLPGRSRPSRCRADASLVQNLPYRARGDLIAEADQFTVNPAMPPGRVLLGDSQHEVADLASDRWPAGSGVRIGPVPGDQLAMPAQQRRGRGEEDRAEHAASRRRPAGHRCVAPAHPDTTGH
jgi:hypothetical protein